MAEQDRRIKSKHKPVVPTQKQALYLEDEQLPPDLNELCYQISKSRIVNKLENLPWSEVLSSNPAKHPAGI